MDRGFDVKRLWLLMVSQGGRWTTREIRQEIPSLLTTNLSATLKEMAEGGQIKRYEGGAKPSYGVTESCRIPRFITVAELAAAGVVLAKEGSAA